MKRADIFSLGVLASTALGSALVYPRLPAQVATHFDLRGVANDWQPRGVAVWLLPAFGAGLWLVMRVLAPRMKKSGGPPEWAAAGTLGFVCALHVFLLGHALDASLDVNRGAALLIGALFVVLGLLMPRARQNPLFGVRTYWTLRSPESWAKTNRLAGTLFVLGGVLVVLGGLLFPAAAIGLVIAVALAIAVVSTIASYRYAQ